MYRNLVIQPPKIASPPKVYHSFQSPLTAFSPSGSYIYGQASPTTVLGSGRLASPIRDGSLQKYRSNEPLRTSYFPEKSLIDRQKSYFVQKHKTTIETPQIELRDQVTKITYMDGSIYYGQTLGQKKHGKGALYTSSNKLIYCGEWKDDKFNGMGIWNNGNLTYKGSFEDGYVNGEAVEESKTFKFYGYFKKGKRNGPGTLYAKNQVTQAIWKDNTIQLLC